MIGGDFSEGGGGRVLPVPEWMTHTTTRLPSEDEIAPWYDAVCALWDDPALYGAMSARARARAIAEERYSESVSRRKHLDYFTSLSQGQRPFVEPPTD